MKSAQQIKKSLKSKDTIVFNIEIDRQCHKERNDSDNDGGQDDFAAAVVGVVIYIDGPGILRVNFVWCLFRDVDARTGGADGGLPVVDDSSPKPVFIAL